MGVRRGAVSLLVNDLLKEGLVVEGATGETLRGRKPTFLYIDSRRRAVVAVDVRASKTFVQLTDLLGKAVAGIVNFADAARSEGVRPGARGSHPRASGGAPRCLQHRGPRRRGPRHGRAFDDADSACADAGLAQRASARAAGGGDRARGADRELRPRVRAGAGLGGSRRAARRATWSSSASRTASASA